MSADPVLFGRLCKVTVWQQPQTIGSLDPSFFEKLGNGTEITDLRMQFNIDKHLSGEPNACTITITGLNQSSRIAICKKPLHVRVDAGFRDTGARNIFMGDLHFGSSKQNGTDWETKIQVKDGGRAYGFAHSSRSFTKGVTVRECLTYAASTMNLLLPPELEQVPELSQALANGISMHGPTRIVLTRLLAPYGLHWSIQNQRLQIISDTTILPGEAYIINTAKGLIGSPERAAPDKTTGRSEVTFDVELYPELIPGATVQLESEDISGTFKIIQVTHVGDTRGEDFKSTVKVVPR